MNRALRGDLIRQAELQKGLQLMTDNAAATLLVRELYLRALARRYAGGAAIEPGALTFDAAGQVVWNRKDAVSAAPAMVTVGRRQLA